MKLLTQKKVKIFGKSKDEIKSIYFNAFPKKERMPFFMMLLLAKMPNTDFLSFYDGDKAVGLIYLAKGFSEVFIMFFAVDDKLRSQGYGSQILQMIQNHYPQKKIIVTIEECDEKAADYEIRNRRRNFYFRNGYSATGYKTRMANVKQEVIISNGTFHKWQFKLFMLFYSFGAMVPPLWKE